MTCRICYEQCTSVSPCACTGTMKYVHPDCLLKWRSVSENDVCEICNHPYVAKHRLVMPFLMFCLGMLAHRLELVMLFMFFPSPFRYFAAGAFVAKCTFI